MKGKYKSVTLSNGHTSSVRALVYHPESCSLVTGASDRKVKVWLLGASGEFVNQGTLTGPNAGVVALRLALSSPAATTLNGATLTAGYRNGYVKTWRHISTAGAGVNTWEGSADEAWGVISERQLATNAEGFLFADRQTVLWDEAVHVLDNERGVLVLTYGAHTKKVTCVDFVPGSATNMLSSSLDKTVRLWDTRTAATGSAGQAVLKGHTAGVNSFAFLSDSTVATASNDRSVRLWDLRSPRRPLTTLLGHVSPVRCVWCGSALGRRSLLLSGSDDHSVRLWSATTGSLVQKYEEHMTPVTCLAADARRLISASSDGVVRVSDFLQTD